MGLTILTNNKDQVTTIVTWFLSKNGILDFACGPVIKFETKEFRENGWEFIHQHFSQYRVKRVDLGEVVKVFDSPKENRKLASRQVVRIDEIPLGSVRLIPLKIEKLSLTGLKTLPNYRERHVLTTAAADLFWKAFDEVLIDIATEDDQ